LFATSITTSIESTLTAHIHRRHVGRQANLN
jgi:hypothetical protein